MYQMRSEAAVAGMGPDAWAAVQQNSTRIVGSGARAVFFSGSCGGGGGDGGGGAAVKSGRAGTGVFLPRRYGNTDCNAYSSDSRKRPGILQFSAFPFLPFS